MASAAEAELRAAVVARLRQLRPHARICHEVNVSTNGPNRMDVLAVDTSEIIAVEIKSERDKMDRAEAQIAAMKGCAHHVVLAIHECHLVEHTTNPYVAWYGKLDGHHYMRSAPKDARKAGFVWTYPEIVRGQDGVGGWDTDMWRTPPLVMQAALPSTALDMLWRDELAELCDRLRVSRGKRSTMLEMQAALRWHCNGRELTAGVCRALRQRRFADADPPIDEPALRGRELV